MTDEATTQAREAVRLDPDLAEARRLLGSLELAAAEKDPSRLPAAIERAVGGPSPRAERCRDLGDPGACAARGRPGRGSRGHPRRPSRARRPAGDPATHGGGQGQERTVSRGRGALPGAVRGRSGRPGDRGRAHRSLRGRGQARRSARRSWRSWPRAIPRTRRSGSGSCSIWPGRAVFRNRRRRPASSSRNAPRTAPAQRLLATVLFERGSIAEGEKILRGLLESDPDDPVTRRALAAELVRERRFDEARAMYQETIHRAGDDPRKARERRAPPRSSSVSSRTSKRTTRARARSLRPWPSRTGRCRTGPPASCSPPIGTARTSPTARRARAGAARGQTVGSRMAGRDAPSSGTGSARRRPRRKRSMRSAPRASSRR